MFKQWIAHGVALLAMTVAASALGAEAYPTRPVRMIVPYAPGGATDVVARLIAQKLSLALKQQFIVENKAGANGMIGTEAVAKASPDGYTLLMNTSGAQTLNTVLYKANYDAVKSFEPIAQIATIPFVMVVHPSLPVKTVQDYVNLAQSKSRPMSLASGTAMIELVSETFKSTTKIPDVVTVPYKGTGPQTAAVVAGEAEMGIDPFLSIPMIKAGKLRALAVLSVHRSPALPDVPTMQEAGVAGMNFNSWAGLLAPAGTPKEIVDRLAEEVARIVATQELRDRLTTLDYEPVVSSPEKFTSALKEEVARWQKIVKDTGYKVSP